MPIKAFRFAAATRAQTDTGLEGDLADHYRFFTAISELVGHGNSGIAIATGTLSRTAKNEIPN
jgi:hypothetical protein